MASDVDKILVSNFRTVENKEAKEPIITKKDRGPRD